MDTREITQIFTAMLREGKDVGAAFRHDEVSSIEAMGGSLAIRGKDAVTAKGAAWCTAHEVNDIVVEGPSVNDHQSALHMEMDITKRANGQRKQRKEVGLHTVQDGKVVEERFFY